MASNLALPVSRAIKRVAMCRLCVTFVDCTNQTTSLQYLRQPFGCPSQVGTVPPSRDDILKTRINSCSGCAVEQDQLLRYQCSNC